ncbi:hypothetical protein HA402_014835 [Bradysia odoriphaga]|nr:hypothetical protein HA402_014835 [Bradysia odoriphaga]
MGENNRSSSIVAEDVDSKLKQYMLINKQISRTLTTQRIEISTLKNSLRACDAELMQLRLDCYKYKTKYEELSQMYITHVNSLTCVLQANLDTYNTYKGTSVANLHETCNALVDQIVNSPKSVPQNVENSRRVSKSFDLNKNRSQKRNDESVADSMHTIEEEDEDEISADVSVELQDSSDANGSDTIVDNSRVESGEDSKDSLDDLLTAVQTSNEILEENQLAAEQSAKTDGVTVGDDEESGASDDESDGSDEDSGTRDEESGASDEERGARDEKSGKNVEENRENVKESGVSDEESGVSDEDSDISDEESGGSDEENCGSDEESLGSDDVSDGSDKAHDETNVENGVVFEEMEVTVVSVADNEVSSEEESEASSDTENNSENSHSLNQTSVLAAHDDSTITNDDDSDKENDIANDSISTHLISKNTSSVISVDSDTFDKSTPVKKSKKLGTNKKKAITTSDQSISLTYGSMEEQSLVSSTPYRNSNASSDASIDTTIPVQSSKSRTSSRTLSTLSTTYQSSTSSSASSGRPKRKAAPVVLSEPKLNTKLRRPR